MKRNIYILRILVLLKGCSRKMTVLADSKDDKQILRIMDVEDTEMSTILVNVFGESPQIRVLDFFMDFPMNDYMQSEIAEKTGMNSRTVKKVLASLFENKNFWVNKEIAKTVLYKINSKNEIVIKLKEIERMQSLQSIEE